jgi:AcrR family transcriptional regulator
VHVNHIADAAGVAKGAFFNVYPSKAEVLVEVLQEIDDQLAVLIGQMQPSQPRRSIKMLAERAAAVLEPYAAIAPALAVEMARRPQFARPGLRSTPQNSTGFSVVAKGLERPLYHLFDHDAVARLLAELWASALMDWMRQPTSSFAERFGESQRLFFNLLYREVG